MWDGAADAVTRALRGKEFFACLAHPGRIFFLGWGEKEKSRRVRLLVRGQESATCLSLQLHFSIISRGYCIVITISRRSAGVGLGVS